MTHLVAPVNVLVFAIFPYVDQGLPLLLPRATLWKDVHLSLAKL